MNCWHFQRRQNIDRSISIAEAPSGRPGRVGRGVLPPIGDGRDVKGWVRTVVRTFEVWSTSGSTVNRSAAGLCLQDDYNVFFSNTWIFKLGSGERPFFFRHYVDSSTPAGPAVVTRSVDLWDRGQSARLQAGRALGRGRSLCADP